MIRDFFSQFIWNMANSSWNIVPGQRHLALRLQRIQMDSDSDMESNNSDDDLDRESDISDAGDVGGADGHDIGIQHLNRKISSKYANFSLYFPIQPKIMIKINKK